MKLNFIASLIEMFFCSAKEEWRVVGLNLSHVASMLLAFVTFFFALFLGLLFCQQLVVSRLATSRSEERNWFLHAEIDFSTLDRRASCLV